VAEAASAEHQRRGVVPGSLGVMLPQRRQPVPGRPAAGVCRVDDDHVKAGVGGHLDEAVPEPAGGNAGDEVPEPAAAPAARGPAACFLASQGACFGEIEVLDDDRPCSGLPGGGDEAGYRCADPRVSGGRGEPGQVEGDG
jgi:hypothetical protein